jgi:acylglycerol lipase
MVALGPPVLAVNDPGTSEEGTFESSHDKLTLYLKRWIPSGVSASPSKAPRAAIVFCHGFIEYYGRYENIFKLFAQANILVTAFDQRGFGLSWTKHATPKKAHGNTTWKQQFEDVEDLIKVERSKLDEQFGKDKVPIFLMGHSMVSGTFPEGRGSC